MTRSTDALKNAARRRHQEAESAVARALREARKTNTPITFTGLAAAAGVSTDFLYRHPGVRAQIEALRRTRRRSPAHALTSNDSDAAESALIRRLSHQLIDLRRQHRDEVAELHRALAAAHGELLELRRKLQDEPGARGASE
jgi:hypothetical protein